jgi:1-acyl-sn-glycerol-3-phosphate acyltransferase
MAQATRRSIDEAAPSNHPPLGYSRAQPGPAGTGGLLDAKILLNLEPAVLRAVLPDFLAGYIHDPAAARASKARIQALVADWSDVVCQEILANLAGLGAETRVYDPHPQARALSRRWSQDVVTSVDLHGLHHLEAAVAQGPVVLICNHLSYFDSTAIDAALAWIDHPSADRIVSAAGPKVYADTFRRIASGCIATLPVPQSGQLDHVQALPPRELARLARAALDAGRAALDAGRHLLLYAEGARSRTRRLGAFLPATARYLAFPNTIVVPVALSGTDVMMPIERNTLSPGSLLVQFGEPIVVAHHTEPREALAAVHAQIASLLPEEYRPE